MFKWSGYGLFLGFVLAVTLLRLSDCRNPLCALLSFVCVCVCVQAYRTGVCVCVSPYLGVVYGDYVFVCVCVCVCVCSFVHSVQYDSIQLFLTGP